MKDMYELDLRQVTKIQTALIIAASAEDEVVGQMSEAADRLARSGWAEEAQLARGAARAALARAAEYRGLLKVFE